MKKYGIVILALILITILVNKNPLKPDKTRFPSPTEIVEEREGNSLEREKWINEMHQAAPGINWRMMDQDFRLQRSHSLISAQYRSTHISLAGGALRGSWYETGSDNQAGRIHLSEYDTTTGELITASAGGNIWIGSLSGNSWQVINDHFKIPGIIALRVVYINNNRRIIAASGTFGIEGVFYTDDDGSTWHVSNGLGNIARWGNIVRMVITPQNPSTIYFLAQEWDYTNWKKITSVYQSTDMGNTFTQILSFSSASYGPVSNFDLWCDYYHSSLPYLLIDDAVYKIQSNGQVALLGSAGFTNDGTVHLAGYEKGSKLIFYIAVKHSSSTSFYRSLNSGTVWTKMTDLDQKPFRKTSFICSASNPDNLYFGSVDCYRSHNGGLSWQLVNKWGAYYGDPENRLHADIPAINSFVINGSEKALISTDGGIFLSSDSLVSVKNLSLLNHNVSQYYSVYTCRFEPEIIHAGAQDQGYQKSTTTSGIRSFRQIISGDYGHIVSGDDGSSIWMVYPGFAIYYPNINGSNSSKRWNFTMTGHYWIPPLMEDPDDAEKVYLAGGSTTSGSRIFHLSYYNNSGIVAEEESFNFSRGGSKISAMEYSHLNTNIRYVLTSKGDFYLSQDAGQNWTLQSVVSDFGAHYFYGADILASQKDSGTVFIAGSGYSNPGIYVSYDYGKKFTALDSNLPSTLFYKLATDSGENYLFAASATGPYVYIFEKQSWFDLSDGKAPDQNYWSVDYVPAIHTARFGTYGRGIWDFVLCDSAESWVTAAFTAKPTGLNVSFQNNSVNADSFYWEFGDGNFSGDENPVHIFSSKGTYKVKLIAMNNCFTDSFTYEVTVYPVGIEANIEQPTLIVYPNPSDGRFFIELNDARQGFVQIQIIDVSGSIVYTRIYTSVFETFKTELELTGLPSGNYFIRAVINGQNIVKSILITGFPAH